MKKLLFLYNTHAGKGLLKSRLAAVQDALAAAGWDVTIHPTQGAGDATAVAAARAGEFDRIVCSGGDGTLHEVVAGLMGLENRPEVGYITAGTTNDFGKNLSLPTRYAQSKSQGNRGKPLGQVFPRIVWRKHRRITHSLTNRIVKTTWQYDSSRTKREYFPQPDLYTRIFLYLCTPFRTKTKTANQFSKHD